MTLIHVDYYPPHLQRAPLHEHRPFKFLERFNRDKAECLGLAGAEAEIDDEHAPTHPLDPRAHFIVRVPVRSDAERARRKIERYLRATYKTPAEAADEAFKGFTSFLRVLAGALSTTPAGAVLAAAVGVSDAVDDIPAAIADGLDAGDLDTALAVIAAVEQIIDAEEDRRGVDSGGPAFASLTPSLAARIRGLK